MSTSMPLAGGGLLAEGLWLDWRTHLLFLTVALSIPVAMFVWDVIRERRRVRRLLERGLPGGPDLNE